MNREYTFNDAVKRRNPRKYTQTIIRTAKTAEKMTHLIIYWSFGMVSMLNPNNILKTHEVITLNFF